jgi:signal transduction histidine kinase
MFEHTSEHTLRARARRRRAAVSVDADRMRQTLRNLISNATKYSPTAGR